jgi:glycosyltransferase involved in cell wall biosynthesis
MSAPKVSIIVPCYNQAQYLDQALQSVLDQIYTNWECIIVNDGSPDNTEEIAKKWIEKDSRFKYILKKNGGVSSARNLGLDKAKGAYIQFLDSDDLLGERKLEMSLQELNLTANEGANLVISNFKMFKEDRNITTVPYCNLSAELFTFENLLYCWNASFTIPIHCGFFETSLFANLRFSEKLSAQEDWIMWVSLFQKGCRALFIDQTLVLYRINSLSRTMTKTLHLDQLKAYEYFKNHLSDEEFYKVSLVLVSRYYKANDDLKFRLSAVKNSNTYQTGLMFKKILKLIGLLKPFKYLFPIVLKFKSK